MQLAVNIYLKISLYTKVEKGLIENNKGWLQKLKAAQQVMAELFITNI